MTISLTPSIFDIQAEFCKVMGNATRLQIIHVLRDNPMNVGEISQATGFGQTVISRQLGALRNAGIVQNQRNGNEVNYRLTDNNIVEVCDLVRKVLYTQVKKQSKTFQR
jgi:DNA-binding transcriptional ArsR family regulator